MLTRRVAVASLVLPALVLVAFAARSYQPFGGDAGGERAASTTFVDSLYTVVVVLGVVLTVVLVWVRLSAAGRHANRDQNSLMGLVVYLLVVVIAVAAGRALMHHKLQSDGGGGGELAVSQKPGPEQLTPAAKHVRSPRVMWPLVGGIGALIAAAAITALVVARRRRTAARASVTALEELARALDEAIEDLRRDPDPRRAVIAAYARMEQALSVYGLSRRPAETPYEYLGRVAQELEAEDSVAALTELFEVAKFSEHSVDETMRGHAIDALFAVREEVRAAA